MNVRFYLSYNLKITLKSHFCCKNAILLGDNCIQNFHLGRYIVGYAVGNLVLRRRVSSHYLILVVKRTLNNIAYQLHPKYTGPELGRG